MKVLKIRIDKEARYYRWEQDREYFHPGETVSGNVQFDDATKPPPRGTRVIWTDSYDRRVRATPGRWNAGRGCLSFAFPPDGQVALANFLHVEMPGSRQPQGQTRFVVTRALGAWDDYHIFLWATYPYGYYDELRKMGIDGCIAYKRVDFDHVLENDFVCYVDQVCPDEMGVYHRPYSQYIEPVNPKNDQPSFYLRHWNMVRNRYKEARDRLRPLSVALDKEGQKTLWRASCPSDRGVQAKIRERMMNTVVQHKNIRPMFYNMADEHGTGDQAAPFDFCYCKHCMDRFRPWLEQRYGTLTNLNAEWGTDFSLWREVLPLTTDDTLRRHAGSKDFNFSSWADHREFMDDVMNDGLAAMREYGREADPTSVFASTGGQGPGAYGGWDYAKIAKSVDLHIPYNIFQNDEMLRSFRPKILKFAPFFGDSIELVRRMWYQLFHGDCGQIYWDNDQDGGRFLERPTKKLSLRAERLGPTIKELTSGMAKQIMAMEPTHEHLAVHHSQASIRANWFIGTIPQGEKWVDRNSGNCEAFETDMIWHARDAVSKLVADTGLQYRFLAYDAVADGGLIGEGFKAFWMPHSLAMSADECEQVRRFAEAGGVVIADTLPAIMDEHCKLLPKGQLDDFFGVTRAKFDYAKKGAAIRVTSDGERLALSAGKLGVNACEPTLKAAGDAIACGKAGKADALIIRKVGLGFAIYLNTELRNYPVYRYLVGSPQQRDTQSIFTASLALAGIQREINLWKSKRAGHQTPGVEVTRFAAGPVELACAVVNAARGTSGVGEEVEINNGVFDKSTAMTVEIPAERHCYDSRTGEYHGLTDKFKSRFDPVSAKVYALLPYQVTGIEAKPVGKPKAGKTATIRLKLNAVAGRGEAGSSDKGKAGLPGIHVIRVDVHDPKGEWCSYYSQNVRTDGGAGKVDIPFAAGDRPGTWTLQLRDIVTGTTATVKLKIGK
jgi:glycosyl hydrolase family 42 (putative beta-galactosidase)